MNGREKEGESRLAQFFSYTIYQASLREAWNRSEQFNKQENHQNKVQSWLSSDSVRVAVPSVNDDDSFSGCSDSLCGAESVSRDHCRTIWIKCIWAKVQLCTDW